MRFSVKTFGISSWALLFQACQFSGDSAQNIVNTTGTATSDLSAEWYSTKDHGGTSNLRIGLSQDGTSVESRDGGVTKIQVVFSQDIQASTFTTSAVTTTGRDTNNNSSTGSLPAIQSMTYSSSTKTGTITFASGLPDVSRYLITLTGIQTSSGIALGSASTSRGFYVLVGDSDGNKTVEAGGADMTLVTGAFGANLNSSSSETLIRTDLDQDGQIDQDDIDLMSFADTTTVAHILAP